MEPHMLALRRANEFRTRRGKLKAQIKRGEVLLSELLAEVELPDWLHGMPINQLLAAIHLVSDKSACGLLDELHIPNTKLIGKMTYRQRRAVAAEAVKLEGRGKGTRPQRSGRRAIRATYGMATGKPINFRTPLASGRKLA